MSAIRRRMHRITPILYTGLTIYVLYSIYYTVLFTGLTIYYIIYTVLYYILASLYTIFYIILYYILASLSCGRCCRLFWHYLRFLCASAESHKFPIEVPIFVVFVVFFVVSLLMILQRHPSNCTNWPLSRRSGSFVEIKVHQAPILRLLPIKNPFPAKAVDPLSFNSIGTQCTLDYLKYVFFYILF